MIVSTATMESEPISIDLRARSDSLAELHARQYVPMVRLATALVGDAAIAEEVVQQAFVDVFAGWRRIRDHAKASQYLRSAVLNQARRRRNRRDVRGRLSAVVSEPVPTPEDEVLGSARRTALLRALWQLPTRQRECLVLRYYEDLKDREIAEALGIAAGTVKAHIHRGLAALGTMESVR